MPASKGAHEAPVADTDGAFLKWIRIEPAAPERGVEAFTDAMDDATQH